AAKGLEFPAVVIIGMEEGLLPGMRAMESDAEMEEERRLCFVGITRAKQTLMMTCARYRMQRGQTLATQPSRFLNELPADGVQVSDQSDAYHEGHDEFDQRASWERRGGQGSRAGDSGSPRPRRGGGLYDWIVAGAGVRHPQFGAGRVLSVTPGGADARARIVFQDCGTKTLVLKYARLEPFDLSIFT
ncbi:MAG: ATP-binding domain-containing protein, partial [Phycisphaerales bacterium]|nr:ATP-binding domain-containing protein [Phycisphaerales bacterium]